MFDGTSFRTVEVDGVRYGYYFLCERAGSTDAGQFTWGVLGTPKVVAVDSVGQLVLRSAPQTRSLFADPANLGIEDVASSSLTMGSAEWIQRHERLDVVCPDGWSIRCIPTIFGSLSVEVHVRFSPGTAVGILVHAEPFAAHPGPHADQSSLLVLLDSNRDALLLTRLRDFTTICSRTVELIPDIDYALRVVAMGEFIEVYLNGALIINTVRYELRSGMIGLFVERGDASFTNLVVNEANDANL
jgi:hypothetical protein